MTLDVVDALGSGRNQQSNKQTNSQTDRHTNKQTQIGL